MNQRKEKSTQEPGSTGESKSDKLKGKADRDSLTTTQLTSELDQQREWIAELEDELEYRHRQILELRHEKDIIERSLSWNLAAPLRTLKAFFNPNTDNSRIIRNRKRRKASSSTLEPSQVSPHKKKPSILVIDSTTPKPDHDSGSVRLLAIINAMQQLGFDVVFCPENMIRVEPYSTRLEEQNVEVISWPHTSSFDTWLATNSAKLDYIYVCRHRILTMLIDSIRTYCGNAILIFDSVDLHFLREKRQADVTNDSKLLAQARVTEQNEKKLIELSDRVIVVSKDEKTMLETTVRKENIYVLSNIHHIDRTPTAWNNRRGMLFVGGYQHYPNVDAAHWLIEEIWPIVQKSLPCAELLLIGSRMPHSIRSIRKPNVKIIGHVKDLKPYYSNSRLALGPIRFGAGVKGKLTQAQSHGLPIIVTSCAGEGMHLTHEQNALIADTSESFAQMIVEGYTNELLWERIASGGIQNVERHFSYTAAKKSLATILGVNE